LSIAGEQEPTLTKKPKLVGKFGARDPTVFLGEPGRSYGVKKFLAPNGVQKSQEYGDQQGKNLTKRRKTMKATSKNWKMAFSVTICLFIFISVATDTAHSQAKKGLGTKWEPIKIGTLLNYGYIPSHKAVDFLNERGIFAAAYTFPSAVERLEAVGGGYLNLSYAGLTATIMLSAAGKDIVTVCSADDGGRGIVARKEIKSLQDLKGKKVGTVFGSIEHMSLIAELQTAGVTGVDIVNIGGYDLLPPAMAQGAIQAYCGTEPFVQMGLSSEFGGHLLSDATNSPMGAIDGGIETTREFISKYPELVYQVVKAHVEAVEYYNKYPEEAKLDAIRRFKLPKEYADAMAKNTKFTYNTNLGNMKAVADFLMQKGYIKTKPDWNTLIDEQFLKKAKAELKIQ
jgi:NitT/TauT family transport system substrate-binding protein